MITTPSLGREPDIYEIFIFYDTVDELWASLTGMSAHSRNKTRIFELFQEIAQAIPVKVPYGYLKKCWEELKHYNSLANVEGMTLAIAKVINTQLEEHKLYQFLMGLRPNPLPSLGNAYAMIKEVESRERLAAKSPKAEVISTLGQMVFIVASGSRNQSAPTGCSYCKGNTHIKDTCWKLHP